MKSHRQEVEDFAALVSDLDATRSAPTSEPLIVRRWSYGDVENNGVYYHPQLTHYGHQAFEELFLSRMQFHYTDLSRRTPESERVRAQHVPPIPRMTFPVGWLHQWMRWPMHAGELCLFWIDTVDVASDRIGVRAWCYTEARVLAAVVIWLRWAKELDPRKTVPIPDWFPRARLD